MGGFIYGCVQDSMATSKLSSRTLLGVFRRNRTWLLASGLFFAILIANPTPSQGEDSCGPNFKKLTRARSGENYELPAEARRDGSRFLEVFRNRALPWMGATLVAYAPTLVARANDYRPWFLEHSSNLFHGLTLGLVTELALHHATRFASQSPRLARLGVSSVLLAGNVATELVLTRDLGDFSLGVAAIPLYYGLSRWLYKGADRDVARESTPPP